MARILQCYGVGQALIPVLPPPIGFQNPPTSSQTNFDIGQIVFTPIDQPTSFYMYGGAGNWVLFASGSGDIVNIIPVAPVTSNISSGVATVGLAGPPNVTTLTNHGVVLGQGTSAVVATAAGTAGQFLVSGGSSADPTWQTATPQLTVTPVAGTSQAMVVNSTYIANAAGLTTFTLPVTAAVGSIINIVGSALNTGGWKVTYTTGQIIWGPAGSSTVTTGNAASAAAAAQCMQIMCVVANTTWVIQDNSGTITLT